MEPDECFVGIDVSRATLDVATRPAAPPWTEAHTEAGITTRVARLKSLKPTLIVLEATGGLELPLAGALGAAPPLRAAVPRSAGHSYGNHVRRYRTPF